MCIPVVVTGERGHLVVPAVVVLARRGKAHHGQLQVRQWALRQHAIVFEVHQQVVPQVMSRQNLGRGGECVCTCERVCEYSKCESVCECVGVRVCECV